MLEQELIESRDLEAQLRDAFSGVQQQLSALKEEELNTIKQLEEQSIQLNKSEVHNLSLEKRCKVRDWSLCEALLYCGVCSTFKPSKPNCCSVWMSWNRSVASCRRK